MKVMRLVPGRYEELVTVLLNNSGDLHERIPVLVMSGDWEGIDLPPQLSIYVAE
jgi:hypothetical protein